MPKERNCIKILSLIFILIEVALFPLIQLLPADGSAFFSYVAIVCVALFALLTVRGEKDGHFIRLGILFTLFADYFLVISYDAELEGVLFFICAQLSYFAYLFAVENRGRVRFFNITTRVALSAVLVFVAFIVLGNDTDALAVASVIYYGNLLVNIVFAFLRYREEKLFAIGLVLFAMCDLCIGLDVLFGAYLKLDISGSIFYSAYHNLPWVFYQPSQVFIGLRLAEKIDVLSLTENTQ